MTTPSPDETPTISGSGTVVAYTRAFSATTADAGVLGVAVVDRTVPLGQQGRTQPVAGSPAAAPSTTFRYHGLHEPAVSDDGRFVAFTADADAAAPVPVWSSGDVAGGYATSQVYVWDRQGSGAAAVSRVSSPAATVANGDGGHPAISHDGRFVAFESTATNLVAGAVLPACTAPAVPTAATPSTTTAPASTTSAPADPVADASTTECAQPDDDRRRRRPDGRRSRFADGRRGDSPTAGGPIRRRPARPIRRRLPRPTRRRPTKPRTPSSR